MLFNSYGFLFVFLPLTLTGFFWLGRHSGLLAAAWLTLASLAFYGWWDWRFVPLLVASIAFNYVMGLVIARTHGRSRQRWFVIAVAADLMLLGYFKYAGHLVSSRVGGQWRQSATSFHCWYAKWPNYRQPHMSIVNAESLWRIDL